MRTENRRDIQLRSRLFGQAVRFYRVRRGRCIGSAIMATATEQLIAWSTDFDAGLERARNTGKYVLLDFSAAPM